MYKNISEKIEENQKMIDALNNSDNLSDFKSVYVLDNILNNHI